MARPRVTYLVAEVLDLVLGDRLVLVQLLDLAIEDAYLVHRQNGGHGFLSVLRCGR